MVAAKGCAFAFRVSEDCKKTMAGHLPAHGTKVFCISMFCNTWYYKKHHYITRINITFSYFYALSFPKSVAWGMRFALHPCRKGRRADKKSNRKCPGCLMVVWRWSKANSETLCMQLWKALHVFGVRRLSIKVGSINYPPNIHVTGVCCFLSSFAFYASSFVSIIGRIARYTSSSTYKTCSPKRTKSGKSNL